MERLDKAVSIKFSEMDTIREQRVVDVIHPVKVKGKSRTLTSSVLKEKEISDATSSIASSVVVSDVDSVRAMFKTAKESMATQFKP